jgi:RNA recognition motif-containing protein
VGNISYATIEKSLVKLFSDYGFVKHATIIKDKRTGRSRGFGFVEFTKEKEAQQAVSSLHDSFFEGRKLQVIICDYQNEL